MMANWVFMVRLAAGGASGLLAVRFNPDRRIVAFQNADSNRMDWRVTVPYFLGLVLAAFGGARLQQHSFGLGGAPRDSPARFDLRDPSPVPQR